MLRYRCDGKRVQLFRDVNGLTQEALAVAAGYSVKTIWKAEAGGMLRRQTLVDIAGALRVTFEDIVVERQLAATAEQTIEANKRLIAESLEALMSRDLRASLSLVCPDAVFSFPGPASIPFAGTFCGKAKIRRFYEIAFQTLPNVPAELHRIVADKDCADLHLSVTHHSRATGRTFRYPVCIHFQFKNGRIAFLQQLMDYASLIEQFADEGGPYHVE